MKLSARIKAALVDAVRRDGIVLTTTRTHIALERKGFVKGLYVTDAGRAALAEAAEAK
jgi:hypothetical protein